MVWTVLENVCSCLKGLQKLQFLLGLRQQPGGFCMRNRDSGVRYMRPVWVGLLGNEQESQEDLSAVVINLRVPRPE